MAWMILAEATLNASRSRDDFLVVDIIVGVTFLSLLLILAWVFRLLIKNLRETTLHQLRQCEHMDSTERHMAAVDQTLGQVLEELKRRPLS